MSFLLQLKSAWDFNEIKEGAVLWLEWEGMKNTDNQALSSRLSIGKSWRLYTELTLNYFCAVFNNLIEEYDSDKIIAGGASEIDLMTQKGILLVKKLQKFLRDKVLC